MIRSRISKVALVMLAVGLVAATEANALQNEAEQKVAPQGSKAFTDAKCGSCHYVESQQLGKKPAEGKANAAPNLPVEGHIYDPAQLAKYLKKEDTLTNSKKHPGMAFKGSEGQLDTLTLWLTHLSVHDSAKVETPQGK